MTKSELIEKLASHRNLSNAHAAKAIDQLFDAMAEALVRGDRIEIRGFGSFIAKHYPAYRGRNPRTGAIIHVAAKRLPFFKVGKELRTRVNGKPFRSKQVQKRGGRGGTDAY